MYRAPEIIFKMPYDNAVDIWSTGCLLFEMINDMPLFPAEDEHELLQFFTMTLGEIPLNVFKSGRAFDDFFSWSHLQQ